MKPNADETFESTQIGNRPMTTARHTLRIALTCLTTAGLILTGANIANANPVPNPETEKHADGLIAPAEYIAPHFTAVSTKDKRALKAGELPESVDLTQYAVTPGNQQQVGACTAWAIGYTMLGWYSKQAGDEQAFAPMYLFSQTHADNSTTGGGSSARDNYTVTEDQGITTQSDYSQGNYNFTTPPTDIQHVNAAQYKTGTYHRLFSSGKEETGVGSQAQTVIEQALAAGHPVGIGIPSYNSFHYLTKTNYVYDTANIDTYRSGHYVTALGYDSQGVTIENSWGTNWANNGYAKLTWDFINNKAFEAEYLEGIIKYMPETTRRAPSSIDTEITYTDTNELDINWTEPTDPGTTKLSGYTATITGANTTKTYNLNAATTGQEFTGLTPNTTYTFTITATNTLGLTTTATTQAKTDALPPKPVYAPTLHGIHGKIYPTYNKWWWKAATPGSGHITKYTIIVKYRGKVIQKHTYPAKTRKATIKHLKPKRTYKFLISAYNSAGKHTTGTWTGKSR